MFGLADVFDLGFDEIAGIVGRSPAACRQLAVRARARVTDWPISLMRSSVVRLAGALTMTAARGSRIVATSESVLA